MRQQIASRLRAVPILVVFAASAMMLGACSQSLASADRPVCKEADLAAGFLTNFLNDEPGTVTGSAYADSSIQDMYKAAQRPGVSADLQSLVGKAELARKDAGGSNFEFYADTGEDILNVAQYCKDHGFKS